MPYVVYERSEQYRFSQKRKTTPIGRFITWAAKEAVGTTFEKPISLLVQGSFINRAAVGLTAALVIAGLIHLISYIVSPSLTCTTFPAIGGLAGASAGGIAGGVVGGFFGWLVGSIVTALVGKGTYSIAVRVISTVVAWCIATAIGWFAGLITTRLFEKLARRHHRVARGVIYVTVTVAAAMVGMVIYHGGAFVVEHRLIVWSAVCQAAPVVGKWIVRIALWIGIIGIPVGYLITWLSDIDNFYRDIARGVLNPPYLDVQPFGLKQPFPGLRSPLYPHQGFVAFVLDHYSFPLLVVWLVCLTLALLDLTGGLFG